jgi:hypothetical protein
MYGYRRRLHPGFIMGLVILGLIIVILVSAKIKSLVQAWKENRDNKSEQQVLQMQGVQLSYPRSWYETKANELFYAMDSQWYNPFSWGTSDTRVYDIYEQLKNDLDFLELYNAFGVRDGYDLKAWIDGDMNQGEKDQINAILATAGITKRV